MLGLKAPLTPVFTLPGVASLSLLYRWGQAQVFPVWNPKAEGFSVQ